MFSDVKYTVFLFSKQKMILIFRILLPKTKLGNINVIFLQLSNYQTLLHYISFFIRFILVFALYSCERKKIFHIPIAFIALIP